MCCILLIFCWCGLIIFVYNNLLMRKLSFYRFYNKIGLWKFLSLIKKYYYIWYYYNKKKIFFYCFVRKKIYDYKFVFLWKFVCLINEFWKVYEKCDRKIRCIKKELKSINEKIDWKIYICLNKELNKIIIKFSSILKLNNRKFFFLVWNY